MTKEKIHYVLLFLLAPLLISAQDDQCPEKKVPEEWKKKLQKADLKAASKYKDCGDGKELIYPKEGGFVAGSYVRYDVTYHPDKDLFEFSNSAGRAMTRQGTVVFRQGMSIRIEDSHGTGAGGKSVHVDGKKVYEKRYSVGQMGSKKEKLSEKGFLDE